MKYYVYDVFIPVHSNPKHLHTLLLKCPYILIIQTIINETNRLFTIFNEKRPLLIKEEVNDSFIYH